MTSIHAPLIEMRNIEKHFGSVIALAVVSITHIVRHTMAVGDRFTVLNHGKTLGTAQRGQITPEEVQDLMAGGQEMAELEGSLGGTV